MSWFHDKKKKKHESHGTVNIEKAGTDSVMLPLGFVPHTVEAGFGRGEQGAKTCEPIAGDVVTATAMAQGIKLTWTVLGPRTVKWTASRS